jgi:hypothetical protein
MACEDDRFCVLVDRDNYFRLVDAMRDDPMGAGILQSIDEFDMTPAEGRAYVVYWALIFALQSIQEG